MSDRDWERDPAHLALMQWITAWRTMHTASTPVPNMAFTDHIGRAAVRMWKVDHLAKIEIERYFSGSGYDGTCPCCGKSPEQIAAEKHAARADNRPTTV